MHLNELLDSIMVDEFFDNFIDFNTRYNDEKYFDTTKKYDRIHLKELVYNKIEFAKNKFVIS